MYVITGATGNTGQIIATNLLAQGKVVRAIGRSEDKLKDLKAKGAETFVGSVEDVMAMTKAFAGAKAVYLIIPPNPAVSGGFRAYQRKVADALAVAIEKTGVKYVVLLSSIGAELPEGTGPVKGL